jgi:hypothetical protein
MDDLTTQGAADAFQAEAAEHVIDADERAELLVPDCFQDEDGEHSPITARSPRARVS